MKTTILFGIILALCSVSAQEGQKQDKPLELPEFVITGTEKINVPGGTKITPGGGDRFSQKELDRLNSLEKQAPPLLPATPLPTILAPKQEYNGFVRGELGTFLTPECSAGYQTMLSGYDLYARGGFAMSNGHLDNADYSNAHLDLTAGFLAPEKYLFFGGSKTTSYLRYRGESYKLYAVPTAPERTKREFGLGVTVAGNYEGFGYNAGLGLDNSTISQSGDVSFSSLHGELGLSQLWKGFKLNSKLSLELNTLRGNGYNFIQIEAGGDYLTNEIRATAGVGIQIAQNSQGTSQGGVLIKANAEYRLSQNLTLRGFFGTGLQKTDYRQLMTQNPYIADSSEVLFPRLQAEIGGQLVYHPVASLAISGGFRFRSIGDMQTFVPTTTGTFLTSYNDASALEASGEMEWHASGNDDIVGNLTFSSTTLTDGSKTAPYIPPVACSIRYTRSWSAELSTTLALMYYGERNADKQNVVKLAAYTDISLGGSYSISDRVNIFARLNNLLNSEIYLWQGYKERSIFGAVGVVWKF